MGTASEPCKIIRVPPDLKPETRKAMFYDAHVMTWYLATKEDARKWKCQV